MGRSFSGRAQSMVGMVLVNLAVLLGYFLVIRPYQEAKRSADWTETTCTIVRSEVLSTIERDRRNRRLTMYELDLEYTFEYPGLEDARRGTAIDFEVRGRTQDADVVRSLQQRFPHGRKLSCWFNPGDPDQVVLDRGSWWPGGAGVVPFVLFAIGAALVGHGIVRRKRAAGG